VANAERHLSAHFADLQKRDFPKEPFTKLTQPVLTLHGMLDRNAPYGSGVEWASTFPNARLITFERGAHQLWADDPAAIADIDAFLAGEWPERAQRFGRE
jgi:pimeloyl-ACP methyl ester carboxylesterase